MKIENISVQNFKAVSQESIDFKGCSAIITAGNDKGKTSILRGLIDRFRGEKPNLIIKEGEEKGFNIMRLSDGCTIEWKFTEKTESFAYTTKDGIRMTQGVLSAIGQKYFGIKFDIDKFLSSGPALQTKELQKIVGLDFDDIDLRYKQAYADRADANKEFARVSGKNLQEPEIAENPDLKSLNTELDEAIVQNVDINTKWKDENSIFQKNIIKFNDDQINISVSLERASSELNTLNSYKGGILNDFISFDKAKEFVSKLPKPESRKELTGLKPPIEIDTLPMYEKIEEANKQQRLFDSYERDLKDYSDWIAERKQARFNQVKADEKVKSIQAEKNKMIAGAKIPDEFEITETGILYNGLPLTDTQISSSSKYIAALKLGSMVLGKLRTMHFDASFLDKNSLAEIQEWANKNDLQLLIERPDFDGGDIKYQIIES